MVQDGLEGPEPGFGGRRAPLGKFNPKNTAGLKLEELGMMSSSGDVIDEDGLGLQVVEEDRSVLYLFWLVSMEWENRGRTNTSGKGWDTDVDLKDR